MPPPVTARGSGGALSAPPVGSGAKPQLLFLLLRLFNMKIDSDINLVFDNYQCLIEACVDRDFIHK